MTRSSPIGSTTPSTPSHAVCSPSKQVRCWTGRRCSGRQRLRGCRERVVPGRRQRARPGREQRREPVAPPLRAVRIWHRLQARQQRGNRHLASGSDRVTSATRRRDDTGKLRTTQWACGRALPADREPRHLHDPPVSCSPHIWAIARPSLHEPGKLETPGALAPELPATSAIQA